MTETPKETPIIGRNEPCPCKSGKKYKRCCGANAAPKLSQPREPAGNFPPQMDPSALGQFDPQMMMHMSQAIQRLPKGQLQRLQSLMQKAMSGKDVSGEAAEFEKGLPPDFQNMMMSFAGQFAQNESSEGAMAIPALEAPEAPEAPEMSVDQAKDVIAKAVAEGKISREQADQLLAVPTPASPVQNEPEASKAGGFWSKIVGKKDGPNS